jgi:methionyl-tRNA formyltransferase
LSPYPAAWTTLIDAKGKELGLKIFKAEIEPDKDVVPGTVQTDGKTTFKIAAQDGWLAISDLQLSGKKRMVTEDFLRGVHEAEAFKVQ